MRALPRQVRLVPSPAGATLGFVAVVLIDIKKPVGIGAMVDWRAYPVWRRGGVFGQQLSTLEGNTMATYVTLYNFTDQGLKNIEDTVKRVEAAKKAGAAIGLHVKEVVWTQGHY